MLAFRQNMWCHVICMLDWSLTIPYKYNWNHSWKHDSWSWWFQLYLSDRIQSLWWWDNVYTTTCLMFGTTRFISRSSWIHCIHQERFIAVPVAQCQTSSVHRQHASVHTSRYQLDHCLVQKEEWNDPQCQMLPLGLTKKASDHVFFSSSHLIIVYPENMTYNCARGCHWDLSPKS